jgi:polyribonucleotide nucleotidyltransferase
MDAGVPIIKPVAGISIGMMSDEKDYELLTDIIGLEDFSGDMDFKVAGTDTGVTAIQLDVKIPGLTDAQIKAILERAKTARLEILEKIKAVMPTSRASISQYAPKIEQVKIPVDKIGEVIGPGGKVIKNIIATTGAQVDVEDDGTVAISGTDDEAVKKAVEWVTGLVREVQPGETFEGEVKRILPFGAFVEILPGKEGMVHVSKMSTEFVNNPSDIVQIGQKVKVRVVEIDEQGRINLSMLFGEDADKPKAPRPEGAPAAGGTYQPRTPSEHPLAMQFRRERGRTSGGSGDWRSRSSRPGSRPGGFSRDRKPRY